jgi:hypothetical protein
MVFKTRQFERWRRKTELRDEALCGAVDEMEQGLIDADLGGGLFKKRVALPGRGKSGGARTLVATNRGDRWFFVFGFEKNEQENVDTVTLKELKRFAAELLGANPSVLHSFLVSGLVEEICHG